MPIDEAMTAVSKLWELSPMAAIKLVNTDVEGRRFYATAPTRVDKLRLDRLRDSVVALAERHGYPYGRSPQKHTFDQELAVLFADSVPMLPVEAADEEVWAYLTLRVLPDVAIWRWPATSGAPDQTLIHDDEGVRSDSRIDRFLGKRRGVFRQAWWRGYLLGRDACLRLDEDNFINLTDRVSLTGYKVLGRLITQAHLDRIGQSGYHRRLTLRRALVLIGREFGRIAVEALPEERVAAIIGDAFDRATVDVATAAAAKKTAPTTTLAGRTFEQATEDPTDLSSELAADYDHPASTTAKGATLPSPGDTDSTMRFLQAASAYAVVLEPMLVPVDYATAMAMLRQADDHVRELDGHHLAVRIYGDLSDLVGDWASLDDDQRSIVYAALTYFVEDDDVSADASPDGLLDDDEVVDSVFEVLGRERPLG